jgi:hypothetical protein
MRASYKNVIVLSFWFGNEKPHWELFIQKSMSELTKLSSGFNCFIDGNMYNVTLKLLLGVFDLVARASIWSTTQFNGEFGCMDCHHPGAYLSKGVRIWPLLNEMKFMPKDEDFYHRIFRLVERTVSET